MNGGRLFRRPELTLSLTLRGRKEGRKERIKLDP
jgi:hypothetical protein